MDVSLRTRAEQLASEMAGQARTAEDLNGLMRLMMKSALERMLNTELDVHLGRKALPAAAGEATLPTDGPAVAARTAEPSQTPAQGSPNRRNGRSKKTVQG